MYGRYGNVSKRYHHIQRVVHPVTVVRDPYVLIKFYEMHIKGQKPTGSFVMDGVSALEEELDIPFRIDHGCGLGFAILSHDTLNVDVWDKKDPHVLRNTLYGFKTFRGKIRNFEQLDLDDSGSFCIWELGIVNHEKEAWKRYLASSKADADKAAYLSSLINGPL
ncbi:MAG: hypothetical protein V1645_03860 [archaeon]